MALPVNNFFKVGEIMLLKYGHLMLPAGHILDLYWVQYCVWLSNSAPFYENFTELYFDVKHLEKGLNRRGEIFGAFFSKKVVFFQKVSFLQIKCPFFIKSAFIIKNALFSWQVPFLANIKRCPEFLEYTLTR